MSEEVEKKKRKRNRNRNKNKNRNEGGGAVNTNTVTNNKPVQVPQYANPQALTLSIESAGFTEATYLALKRAGIVKIGELAGKGEQELFKIQNASRRTVHEILRTLSALGLKAKEQPHPPQQQHQRGGGQAQQNNRRDERREHRDERPHAPISEEKTKKRKMPTLHERVVRAFLNDKDERGEYQKFRAGQKFGYKNAKGEVVVEPVYDELMPFKEGLAAAEKDGLFGFVDTNGAEVIAFEYDGVLSFSSGLAVVTKGEKSGYIKPDGTLLVRPKFDIASPMKDGRALVRYDDKWAFMDEAGKLYDKMPEGTEVGILF
jgi:hypothetical protein